MEFNDLVYLVFFIIWLLNKLLGKKTPPDQPEPQAGQPVPGEEQPSFQRVPDPSQEQLPPVPGEGHPSFQRVLDPSQEQLPPVSGEGHPSFQRVQDPQAVLAALQAALDARRQALVDQQAYDESVTEKTPVRAAAKVRKVARQPVRRSPTVLAYKISEALLLGDILLEPRSRRR